MSLWSWLFGKKKDVVTHTAGEKIEKGQAVYLKDDDLLYGAVKLKDIKKPEPKADPIAKMMEATKPINRNLNAPSYQEERTRYEKQNNPSKQEEVRRNYETFAHQVDEDNRNRRRREDPDIIDIALTGMAIASIADSFFDDSSNRNSSSYDSGSSGSDWSGDGGGFSGGGSSGSYGDD